MNVFQHQPACLVAGGGDQCQLKKKIGERMMMDRRTQDHVQEMLKQHLRELKAVELIARCPKAVTAVASVSSQYSNNKRVEVHPNGLQDGNWYLAIGVGFKSKEDMQSALVVIENLLGTQASRVVDFSQSKQESDYSKDSVYSCKQLQPMIVDPTTGHPSPSPKIAAEYRAYHGLQAWLFNPWTGVKRHPADIGSDVQGVLIANP